MSRKVTIFSTQTNESQVITTDVNTWGEIKDLATDVNTSGMKAVVRENRTTLESDGAQLPQGDATVFLYPTKVKSGISSGTKAKASAKGAEGAEKVMQNLTPDVSVRDLLYSLKEKFDAAFNGVIQDIDEGRISVNTDALAAQARELEEELGM
tara:strand:- start:348 stop:806 length:459 start_codon:yes stop_codon:yes gene_type:complete